MKTTLQVPYEQANSAKELGARWDAAKKVWFVPDGVDIFHFLRWIPDLKVSKKVSKTLKKGRK